MSKLYGLQTVRLARWLHENGPATRAVMAEETGKSVYSINAITKDAPELFVVCGYQKPARGSLTPVFDIHHVPEYVGRSNLGRPPAGERIRRWLLTHGRPTDVQTIAAGTGMSLSHAKSTITHNRESFVKSEGQRPPRLRGDVPALWWPSRIIPGDKITLIHATPAHLPPIVLTGWTVDGCVAVANGERYQVQR